MKNQEKKIVIANTLFAIMENVTEYTRLLVLIQERIGLEKEWDIKMSERRTEEFSIFKALEVKHTELFEPFLEHSANFPMVTNFITKYLNDINEKREAINSLIDKTYIN